MPLKAKFYNNRLDHLPSAKVYIEQNHRILWIGVEVSGWLVHGK